MDYNVFAESQDKYGGPFKPHKLHFGVHVLLTILTVQSGFFAGLADNSAFVFMITTPYFIAVPDVCERAAKDGCLISGTLYFLNKQVPRLPFK